MAVIAWAGPAHADETLRFGVYTSDKPTTMVVMFRPILNVLQDELSSMLGEAVRISMQVAPDYGSGLKDLVEGRVDFSRFGPASYIHAKDENPTLSILAIESEHGKKTFYGIICVPTDSPIKRISDLTGKTFAFGDKGSTIGRYLSQLYLLDRGITARSLKSFAYLGRHDLVGTSVGLHQYDAGALKEDTFNKLVGHGVAIRAIGRFPNVTKPWIARSGLPARVKGALKTALLTFKKPTALAALGADGFLPGSDSDYDTIRRALARDKDFFGEAKRPGL